MSQSKLILCPLYDTLENLEEIPPKAVKAYLANIHLPEVEKEYQLTQTFLANYSGSHDTFNSYRREVERLLHWAWQVAKKPIKALDRNDLRLYLEFAQKPPLSWITTKRVARFKTHQGERTPNPDWRPFVAHLTKAEHQQGKTIDKKAYQLTNKSIQAIFSGLSTFFTYLQQEMYIEVNPVQLIRQKSRFVQKQQAQKVTRRLSKLQWETVIQTMITKADQDSDYERHLFIMSAFYLLGLRISEISETPGRIPSMSDFAPDKNDRWWFTTVGKGNKVRDIAVPDTMLAALKRYREYLDLTPLPSRSENTPLIHKKRGPGGLGTRQVRNLVQRCFNLAIEKLRANGKTDEADDLATATVHWLRHTSISADVEHRPREHVRDDAGHENAAITDRYIDTDRIARHESAKHKPLSNPEDKVFA